MCNVKSPSKSVRIPVCALALGVALFLCGVCSPAAWAQSESINGTIRGRVTDPSGEAVVGATVKAANVATGYTREAATGDEGYYVMATLPLGSYTVTMEKDGFTLLRFSGIVLDAGRQAVVDGTFKIGDVSTSIEVSGGVPVIDPARIDIGRTISQVEVENLPLTSRNPYNFILFQPGVSGHPNAELGIPRTINTNGFGDRINYQMDGMADTQSDRYGLRLFPISDTYVSQIQTISNSYAPEFGGTTGIIYNVITGSGTNNVHGMFQWIRGPVSTSARPLLLPATRPKPNLLLNTYAMNAGGPLKKDKLFLYGAYEHLYRALPVANAISAANVSALEAPGIGVPASEFNTAPSVQHVQFLDVRSDWNVNSHNQVFLRVNYFRNEYPFNTAVGGLNALSAEADFRDRAHIYGMQWVTLFDSKRVNEFRVSYPLRDQKHIAGSATGLGPAVTISGVAILNGSVSTGDTFTEKHPNWNDNFTYIRGPHTIKVGFGIERIIDVQQSDTFTRYTFKTIADYRAALNGSNRRSYDTVDAIIGDSRVGYISNFYDVFAQDAWQVRPSLLLTYGLRYDRFVSPSANPNAPYASSRQFRNPAGDVSPRVGLAWRLSDKTVVRSSAGVFYDAPPTNLWFLTLSNDASGRSFNASLKPSSPGAPAFPNALTSASAPTLPQDVTTVTPNFKNAYAWNFSLQVSRQLTTNDAFTVGFVNTAGRNLLWLHNSNLINPIGTLADGRPVFDPRVNASTRANPAFNNVTLQDTGANSIYNALVVSYEHRLAHGVQTNVSYSYSHSLSDAPDVNSFEQNLFVEDTTSRLRDRGNAYINHPHSLTASTIWSPSLKMENKFGRTLLNNNQFALLTVVASGDQQNITANANLTGDTKVASVTRPLFIGRNTVRGPKVVQFDLRYTRTLFTLWERVKPQFFVEFNNIFNHPNVTSLNTVVPVDSTGCPKASNNFSLDPLHCGQLSPAGTTLPTTFPAVSTVLQQRLVHFGLAARW
jgi:hypothetical protein